MTPPNTRPPSGPTRTEIRDRYLLQMILPHRVLCIVRLLLMSAAIFAPDGNSNAIPPISCHNCINKQQRKR